MGFVLVGNRMEDDKIHNALLETTNIMLFALKVLDEFEQTGRREGFIAVSDQFKALEKEYGVKVVPTETGGELHQKIFRLLREAREYSDG